MIVIIFFFDLKISARNYQILCNMHYPCEPKPFHGLPQHLDHIRQITSQSDSHSENESKHNNTTNDKNLVQNLVQIIQNQFSPISERSNNKNNNTMWIRDQCSRSGFTPSSTVSDTSRRHTMTSLDADTISNQRVNKSTSAGWRWSRRKCGVCFFYDLCIMI